MSEIDPRPAANAEAALHGFALNTNVIWQTKPGPETEFEAQFIRDVILNGCDSQHHFDENHYEKLAENPLVVYSTDILYQAPDDLLTYLGRLKQVRLYHNGCERLHHDTSYYAQASAVLRSYYDPRLSTANTFFVPLGFQSGFLNEAPETLKTSRKFVWCFAGQVKSHRRRMLKAFDGLGPNCAHLTRTWADPTALNVDQMKRLYSETLFALCPFGNRNPDSFRIMEALEWGCIPVTLTFLGGEDYFRFIYGDHPFIVARTWADARRKVEDLMANPEALTRRQEVAMAWYRRFKAALAEDVRLILSENNGRPALTSKQFAYQRQGQGGFVRALYDLYYGRGLSRRLFRWIISQ